jgi:hypothetical protein
MTQEEKDAVLLETRKVKALEKIANSVEGLALWFEETDKQEWSDRIQYYLAEFHEAQVKKIANGE